MIDRINQIIQNVDELEDSPYEVGNVSDGYHTFDELYEFRKVYNALLFNEWFSNGKYDVHKSLKHNDGNLPFGKSDNFIVCAMLPTGQISNHYKIDDWDLFKVEETEKAKHKFDGHTPKDVLERMVKLTKSMGKVTI